MKTELSSPVGWAVTPGLLPYQPTIAAMEAHADAVARGEAGELVWLLEHPSLYTAGASADPEELLNPRGLPVYETKRGGRYTYHGPGQRIAYLMLDLNTRGRDVRAFVRNLERWLIDTLAHFDVVGEMREDRVGVWVTRDGYNGPQEDKIAAMGVRIRRWTTSHGVALNVAPDLARFRGIVPCGLREHGVTSLADLGRTVTMEEADAALRAAFEGVFGPTMDASAPLVVLDAASA